MYEVHLKYINDQDTECINVLKIAFSNGDEVQEIVGDEMLKCHPILDKMLYVYTDTSFYSVSCRFLKSLEIKKT